MSKLRVEISANEELAYKKWQELFDRLYKLKDKAQGTR